MHRIARCALLAFAAAFGPAVRPAAGQRRFPPDSFRNLQVLPRDIDQRTLVGTMRGIARPRLLEDELAIVLANFRVALSRDSTFLPASSGFVSSRVEARAPHSRTRRDLARRPPASAPGPAVAPAPRGPNLEVMPHTGVSLPLVARAQSHRARTAIVAPEGTFTYGELLDASSRVAACLLSGRENLEEARVTFLIPPGFEHVAVQWGIWRAGGIAVPLAVSHPPPELDFVIRDAGAGIVVAHPDAAATLRPLATAAGARFLTTSAALAAGGGAMALGAEPAPLPAVPESRRAMMVYTSGTTGKPKGVVTTHANIRAQVTSLVEAWGWSADDRILLVLPLHHVHGIVNVVACALWSGATCEMLARFDPDETWARIAAVRLTLFMAVPTVYRRLLAAWEAAPPERRAAMSEGCRRMRLMISGSAALPIQTLERWREISGHTLLERYGMTELGMALSNPLNGERRPGYVGAPLPGVEVRLVDEQGAPLPPGSTGEIEVRGPNVFLEYWRRPDATREAVRDGWFKTGDTAVVEDGAYRILGRTSVDIIKTGGFKVSALEIEEVLRTHPAVAECAVVGVEDADWGERICAAVELKSGTALGLADLQAWARERLAPYKIPKSLLSVPALPRNAMGKVLKPEVAKLF